jgi:hypothetical protein
MTRRFTFAGLLAIAACLATALAAAPAAAQFGSIFNQPPPRPPADVPNAPPDNRYPPQPYYPSNRDQPMSADEPPSQPMPPPMEQPPQERPGADSIQSQPLPPPPGAPPRPQQQQANQPPSSSQSGPARTLPGLPRGQRQPRGTPQPQQPQEASPQPPPANGTSTPPSKAVVELPPPERIANPTAVFEGLDKITGRTTRFEVAIGETVQFGALQVTPEVCYSRPPTETPQTDSFVEVDEVTLKGKTRRIFTGWMFAASPGLNAVEHPIYDVWLLECEGGKLPTLAEAPTSEQQPAPHPRTTRRAPARHTDPRGFLPALR